MKNQYQVIHAIEESVFMAYLIKKIWDIEYIYDMDSSLPTQLLDKYPYLNLFKNILSYLERIAIRNAKLVVPVSDALVEEFGIIDIDKVIVLHDVSLLQNGSGDIAESIRGELNANEILVMYVGNLESYQGIDLLLESFALISGKSENICLAIIGGKSEDIQKYKKVTQELGISSLVRFFGPRPMRNLGGYLSEADILVSPRISGVNTPMKIFSFLESGKAIVATNLRTHSQVLDDQVAVLADPNPEAFADGVLLVAGDKKLRERLGENGKKLAKEKYTFEEFQNSVNFIYDSIDAVHIH